LVLDKKLNTKEITEYLRKLEHQILNSFNDLTQVTLSIDSHNISDSSARNWLGGRMHFRFANQHKNKKIIEDKKEGVYRILIPYIDNDIAPDFGSEQYLLIERSSEGKILGRQTIQNPFYDSGEKFGHGVRFVKSVDADEVITKSIGHGAKKNLESQNVKITIILDSNNLEAIINKERG
jgi:predicted Fe-Mo cluster-binding NifX family protein